MVPDDILPILAEWEACGALTCYDSKSLVLRGRRGKFTAEGVMVEPVKGDIKMVIAQNATTDALDRIGTELDGRHRYSAPVQPFLADVYDFERKLALKTIAAAHPLFETLRLVGLNFPGTGISWSLSLDEPPKVTIAPIENTSEALAFEIGELTQKQEYEIVRRLQRWCAERPGVGKLLFEQCNNTEPLCLPLPECGIAAVPRPL